MTSIAHDSGTAAPALVEDLDAALAAEVEPLQETALVQVVVVASKMGDQPPMRVLCGVMIAAGLLSGRHRLTRAGLRMIVAHTLATASKNLVKRRVDRTRPNARSDNDDHRLRAGTNAAHDETSFPSGHSAGVIAVGAAFSREFPQHRIAALCGAGAVALAQVPRGSHYLSDVIVGSAIGAASEAALDRLVRLITMRRSQLKPDRH